METGTVERANHRAVPPPVEADAELASSIAELKRAIARRIADVAKTPRELLAEEEIVGLRRRLGPSTRVSVRGGRVALVVLFQPDQPSRLPLYVFLASVYQAQLTERVGLEFEGRSRRLLVRAWSRDAGVAGLDRAVVRLVEALASAFESAGKC